MIAVATEAGSDWQLYYGGRSRDVDGVPGRAGALRRAGDRLARRRRGACCRWTRSSATPAEGVLVYCCGPEGLLAATEQRCAAWPAGALHLERFAAKPQPEAAAGEEAPRSRWSCQRSGLTVTVPPGTSIIDALDEQGVSVLSSCLEGVCGTCETAVL